MYKILLLHVITSLTLCSYDKTRNKEMNLDQKMLRNLTFRLM